MTDLEKRWIEAEADALVQDVKQPSIIGKLKELAQKKLADDSEPQSRSSEDK